MLLSVLLGAVLYLIVQFFWYSPLGFGRAWLSLKRVTPEQTIATLSSPTIVPESVLHLIAPAFLMSTAIHALAFVVGKFGPQIFIATLGAMFLLTAGPKYLGQAIRDPEARLLAHIGDGALFLSLAALAAYIVWAAGRVY